MTGSLAGNNQAGINKLNSSLEFKFKMDNRGELEWFLEL